jgi:hypothetical protein
VGEGTLEVRLDVHAVVSWCRGAVVVQRAVAMCFLHRHHVMPLFLMSLFLEEQYPSCGADLLLSFSSALLVLRGGVQCRDFVGPSGELSVGGRQMQGQVPLPLSVRASRPFFLRQLRISAFRLRLHSHAMAACI